MSNLKNGSEDNKILIATKTLEEFIQNANYGEAQKAILESLTEDLNVAKVKRIFKLIFLSTLAVFIFFIDTSFGGTVELALKILLMLCFTVSLDYVFKNKVNVANIQDRLFMVTISSNLLYLNEEFLKNKRDKLLKEVKESQDE